MTELRLFGLLDESNTLDGLWDDILKEELLPRSEEAAPVYCRGSVAVCHSRSFEMIVGNPRNRSIDASSQEPRGDEFWNATPEVARASRDEAIGDPVSF